MPGSLAPLPQGLTVLLAEDNALIALDGEGVLTDGGVAKVIIAATTGEAQQCLDSTHVDAAVLDVRLRDDTTFEVADRLIALGIPFGFATGYSNGTVIPLHMRHVAVLTKPYTAGALMDLVRRLIGEREHPG